MKRIKVLLWCIIVIFVLLAGTYIYVKYDPFKISTETTDAIMFFRQYPAVSEANVFKFTTLDKANQLLKSGTGIVLFGFPSCKWCQAYVEILNEVAKELDVNTIWYYDIKEDRKDTTEEYTQLVDIVEQYLEKDENDNSKVYVPDVYFVKDGKILGHNNDTSTISGMQVEDYYSEEKRSELKEKLKKLIEQVYPNVCDDEKGC